MGDELLSPMCDLKKFMADNEKTRDYLLQSQIENPAEKMSLVYSQYVLHGIGSDIYHGVTMDDLAKRRLAKGFPPNKLLLEEEEEAYRWVNMSPAEKSRQRSTVNEILSRKEWPPEWMIIDANREDSYNRYMENGLGLFAKIMTMKS